MASERRNFDLEAASWDEEPRRVQMAKDLYRAISEEVSPDPAWTALDFGCGTGLVTLQLAARVKQVTGVDSSRGMLEVLGRKVQSFSLHNVLTCRLDLENGDVLDGKYDLVVSTMTLHHVRDTAGLVEQFARVLNPGGRVCLADLDSENGEFQGNNDGVFHFGFDRGQLKMLLADAGFTEITDRTAARVEKPGADGAVKSFSVFLITGRIV